MGLARTTTVFLVCLSVISGCSQNPGDIPSNSKSNQPPSLEVTHGPSYEFQGESVVVFALKPKGNPSGVIALKSVQNGLVETLHEYSFDGMAREGTLAMKESETTIELSLDANCRSITSRSHPFVFPANATHPQSGSSMLTITTDDPELTFWYKMLFVGEHPSSWSHTRPKVKDVVSNSLKYPTMKCYIIAVTLHTESGS